MLPRRFAVAVAGLSSRGWHLLERLGLRDDACVGAVWDPSPSLCTQAFQQGWTVHESLDALCHDAAIDGVVVSCAVRERAEVIERCVNGGKHVLTEPPVAPSRCVAARLYDLADAHGVCLWAASPRRWEDDVRASRLAVRSGRLGRLHALRLTSAEWAPWAQLDSSPTAVESQSTLELIAPHVLDQLAELTTAEVAHLSTLPCLAECGFLATMTLADGALVQIDLRRRSLAGQQTGWLLEGSRAGYSGLRVFTPTAEGEIVDEPIRLEPLPGDPLVGEWLARCAQGASASERQRGEWLAGIYEWLSAALT